MDNINISDLPEVVPKARTVNIVPGQKGERQGREFALDIAKQSKADIQNLMRGIAAADVREQERLDNPPVRMLVDNRENKPLTYVERRIDVYFGSVVPGFILKSIQHILGLTIRRNVNDKTGQLSDTFKNWEWLYIPYKKQAVPILSTNRLPPMGLGDKLVLRPRMTLTNEAGEGYAGVVNMLVNQANAKQRLSGNPMKSRNTKGGGYMKQASDRIARTRGLKDFSVYAGFTKRYGPPDVFPYGAPFLALTATRRRGRKR